MSFAQVQHQVVALAAHQRQLIADSLSRDTSSDSISDISDADRGNDGVAPPILIHSLDDPYFDPFEQVGDESDFGPIHQSPPEDWMLDEDSPPTILADSD